MSKITKKQRESKKIYLTIYHHIKEYGYPPPEMYKQKRYHYTNKLQEAGIIKNLGKNNWIMGKEPIYKFLDNLYKNKVKKTQAVTPSTHPFIRGHGFAFIIFLPKIKNWDKRRKYFASKKISWRSINKGHGESFILKDCKLNVYEKKIVVYHSSNKSLLAKTAKESKSKAFEESLKIIFTIEKFLGSTLKGEDGYRIQFFKQHYALMNNELAKYYNNKKKQLRVVKDGKAWIITDFSNQIHELETINSKTADSDMDNVVNPFFNELKEHFQKTGKTLSIIRMNLMIEDLHKNQTIQEKLTITQMKKISEKIDKLAEATSKQQGFINPLFDGNKPDYLG